MFHLFDRVYLAPIHAYNRTMPRIVVSSGYHLNTDPLEPVKPIYAHDKDLPINIEVISKAISRAYLEKDKVYIYVDDEWYVKTMYFWLKCITKNYTVEDFSKFWKIHIHSLSSIHQEYYQLLIDTLTDEIKEDLESIDKSDLTRISDLRPKVLSKLSLEFKVADYLSTGKGMLLRGDVANITRRAVAQHLAETLRDIKTSAYSIKKAELLGYEISELDDLETLNQIQPLFRNMKFFSAVQFWPDSDLPLLEGLTEDALADLRDDLQLLIDNSIDAGSSMLKWMAEFLDLAVKRATEVTDGDIDKFISALSAISVDLSFIPTPDLKKINQVFIYKVLNNDPSFVKAYELAR
jgi:hypothetical protein